MWRTRFGALAASVTVLAFACSVLSYGQGLITQKVLSTELAQAIAQGAIDKCRADGQHISVTVVDASGLVKFAVRDDGSGPHTIDISRRKAYTAVIVKRSTDEFVKAAAARGGPEYPVIEASGGLYSSGGVPIKVGNDVIGGVGVSGGREDDACAVAGAAKVADKLK